MPETPNNGMEELLRKHAEKRRADASGFSLHPATRRLLQGEVRRQFPQGATPGSSRSFLSMLFAWRGTAIAACGLAAVLGTGIWLLSRDDSAAPRASDATLARLDAPAARPPEMPPSRGVEGVLAPALSPAPAEPLPVLTKAVPASGLSGTAADAKPAINFKAMRPAPKAADEMLMAEKQIALNEPARPSLAPAATPAPAGPATKPDFDQAALSAAQQRTLTLNDATPAVLEKGGVPVNAQQNVVQMKTAVPPPPAQVVSASAVQNSAVINNQQQVDLLANAPTAAQAASQNFSRVQQQVAQGAGAEANNSASQARLQTEMQTLNSVPQNAAPGGSAQIAQAASPVGDALPNSNQSDGYRFGAEASTRQAVLSQFTLEHSGDTVRVIDADRSIYAGTPSDEGDVQSTPLREERVAQESPARSSRQRMYRFTGTNRTSGELVVLDAQLPPGTATQQTFVVVQPADLRRSRQGGVAAQTIPSAPTLPSTTPMTRARSGRDTADGTNAVLEGFLRVGGRASEAIRAIPVPVNR